MPKRVFYVLTIIAFLVLLGSQAAMSSAAQWSAGFAGLGPSKFDRLKSIYDRNHPPAYVGKEKVGYYAEDWEGDTASLSALQSYGQHMTAVVPFAYKVDKEGNLSGGISDRTLRTAMDKGVRVYALIHNFNHGFDREIVTAVMNNSTARQNLVNNIYQVIKDRKLAGVNIDLENIKGSDREPFNVFLTELKELLAAKGYLLTISVPAKTWDDPKNAWSGGFDYKHIGTVADQIMIMTYDEHWFDGPAGPVASLPWVEKVIKYAVTEIPREKLLVGIGTYGYDWAIGGGKTKTVTMAKAHVLANKYGAKISWDGNSQVPFFNYWPGPQKHTVWFESTSSALLKANLVKQYGLRGIAVWRLGFEDEAFWAKMEKALAE